MTNADARLSAMNRRRGKKTPNRLAVLLDVQRGLYCQDFDRYYRLDSEVWVRSTPGQTYALNDLTAAGLIQATDGARSRVVGDPLECSHEGDARLVEWGVPPDLTDGEIIDAIYRRSAR